jgi:hypothetical protein
MFARRLLLFAFGTATAVAQCALQPTPTGRGMPSLDGNATKLAAWDPDGAGPEPQRLAVSGVFSLAGDLPCLGVAAFEPVTSQWSPLGELPGQTAAFAVLQNSLLLAGGAFFTPPGTGSVLQLWTGAAWSASIPQPPGQSISALAAAPNGDLVAAAITGFSTTVYRFVGTGWQAIGTAAAVGGAGIRAMVFASNGDLIVGGTFQQIGGVPAANVARWNGSAWSALGTDLQGQVHCLLSTSNGELVAGGLFGVGLPVTNWNVARWSGSFWQGLGSGTQSQLPANAGVRALAELPGGDIVAAGQFEAADGVAAFKVARWNGSAWSAMGGGIEQYGPLGDPSTVFALQATANGELFAAGNFATISDRDGRGLARWNGTAWRPLRPVGIGSVTSAVHRTAGGEVFVGGVFRDIDGVVHNGIAQRIGSSFVPLGSGIGDYGSGPIVRAITSLASGELVVGGWFPTAGGVATPALATWDGFAWASLGGGISKVFATPEVQRLHVAPNGDLLVAGDFDHAGGVPVESLARWNGSAWSPVGSGLGSQLILPVISQVTTAGNGDVFVGGAFALGGFGSLDEVARYDGVAWQLIGTGDQPVRELVGLPNGDLLAAGRFTFVDGVPVGCVARWSNGVWSTVGGLGLTSSCQAECLRLLPGGALLAAGRFEQNGTFFQFARWDGNAWSLFQDEFGVIFDLAVDPDGSVLVAGNLTTIAGVASANLQSLVAPCAGSAVAAGSGCAGSGGGNVLATDQRPWLGAPFLATASGMAANAVASIVLGLGTLNLPLQTVLPQAGASCDLLVSPDVLGFGVPAGGALPVTVPLPATPTLVGSVLHLQVVPFELGPGGITSVTATNRLTLTAGLF